MVCEMMMPLMCGRTEEAIEIWEEGLENAENLVSNNKKSDYINLGLGNRVCSPISCSAHSHVRQNLGRLDEAEQWFKKALEVAPNDPNVCHLPLCHIR